MSVWFTRGWTLQELIAPAIVIFYGRDWVDVGTKITLQDVISAITGIEAKFITRPFVLDDVSVAVRMSWAADRNTTRVEDIAYSLMGIFDVNMPLLYGEGGKAFIRLQQGIIKKSTDHTIFAWTPEIEEDWSGPSGIAPNNKYRGILARSPKEFRSLHKVERTPPAFLDSTPTSLNATPTPYSITNQGLNITLPIVKVPGGQETLALLNCRFPGKSHPVVITLIWSQDLQRYIRSAAIGLDRTTKDDPMWVSLYIADDYHAEHDIIKGTGIDLKLKIHVDPSYGDPLIIPSTGVYQDSQDQWTYIFNPLGYADSLVFDGPSKHEPFTVVVGVQKPGMVWCDILKGTNLSKDDFHEKNIRLTYCTPAGALREVKKPSLDKTSMSLADGWSVAVSLASRSESDFEGRVEIKRLRTYPSVQRPSGTVGYMVTPPSPQHGFAVDMDYRQPMTSPRSPVNWVEYSGSFVLYATDMGIPVLPFRNSKTGEKFYLVRIGRLHGTNMFCSAMENEAPPEGMDPVELERQLANTGDRAFYNHVEYVSENCEKTT